MTGRQKANHKILVITDYIFLMENGWAMRKSNDDQRTSMLKPNVFKNYPWLFRLVAENIILFNAIKIRCNFIGLPRIDVELMAAVLGRGVSIGDHARPSCVISRRTASAASTCCFRPPNICSRRENIEPKSEINPHAIVHCTAFEDLDEVCAMLIC